MTQTAYSQQHRLYLLTIAAKGVLGLIQLAIAAALFLGLFQFLPQYVQSVFAPELLEDPNDFVAIYLLHWANSAPSGQQAFYTYYFAVHGALHVIVVAALLSGLRWANHAAILVLSAFVVYQIYEWLGVGGPMLLVLSVIDLFVIYLTLRETRRR